MNDNEFLSRLSAAYNVYKTENKDTIKVQDFVIWIYKQYGFTLPKNLNTSWTLTVEEDPITKELILPLPDDLLEQMNWKDGEELEWENNNDGSWSLKKIKE